MITQGTAKTDNDLFASLLTLLDRLRNGRAFGCGWYVARVDLTLERLAQPESIDERQDEDIGAGVASAVAAEVVVLRGTATVLSPVERYLLPIATWIVGMTCI